MDDLLSAALNESGLNDFLIEDAGTESGKEEDVDVVGEEEENEKKSEAEELAVPSTSTADLSLLCHDYGQSTPSSSAPPSPATPRSTPSNQKYYVVLAPAQGSGQAALQARAKVVRTHHIVTTTPGGLRRVVGSPQGLERRVVRTAAGSDVVETVRVLSSNRLVGQDSGSTLIRDARGRVYRTTGLPPPARRPMPIYATVAGAPHLKPIRLLTPSLGPEPPTRTLLSVVGPKRTFPEGPQPNAKRPRPDDVKPERAEVEEEDMGHAETYADYRPAKLRSGIAHPDVVVETSSLASVQPPDIRYTVSIPEEIIDEGKLSALQLEAIIYACQQHQCRMPSGERSGYLIGDGAGVGKGRTVAGIIYENYLLGRKRALWLSISSDLKYDAERDLADIGAAALKVHALNKLKYSRISSKENGGIKKGVIFGTYSSLIGESHSAGKAKYKSRLKQLLHWCGKDFDGVIVFDECHRAKNLMPTGGQKPTKTGAAVLELQRALPGARVVYASATGATEPRNMAYMTRIGLWGQGKAFPEFTDFIAAVERKGVSAMEIVAMDMKQRGLYLARQLSFAGVSFRIEEVPLSKEFISIYDRSVKLWVEARAKFSLAANLVEADKGERKTMWAQFWAAHQRYFKYLCIASKVRAVVKLTREAVKNGKSVVIGLQSTGESKTLEQLEEGGELTDFVSTAKAVFQTLIERQFPTNGDEPSFSSDIFRADSMNIHSIASKPKRDLWEKNGAQEPSEDSDTEESGSGSDTDSSNSGEEDGKDWLENLLEEEAKSSSEGEEDEEEEGKSESSAEDDFNPFADNLDDTDPWAAHQQVLEEQSAEEETEKPKKSRKRTKRIAKLRKKGESQVGREGYSAGEFLEGVREVEAERRLGNGGLGGRVGLELNLSRVELIKAELLAEVERLGDYLPPNTLDQLITELGGADAVAEMTGRKGRIVGKEDGEVVYQLRHSGDVPLEILNLTEKNRFMNGEKKIAIISEAASSGISLQADRRAKNQCRRVHITLELPWSADKAIQQFGRTHRSNQVSAPEYLFLISELAGERRFASTVAKRLESLGALTHGDRRATETRDLSQFNLDTKFGRKALEETLKAVLGILNPPRVPPPSDYPVPNFFADIREYLVGVGIFNKEGDGYVVERESANLSKFLNRILGLPVHAQNALFQYFADTLVAVTEEARKDGRYDAGILDLGAGCANVDKKETRVFLGRWESGSHRVELHTVRVERGLSWAEATDTWAAQSGEGDGFYQATGAGGSGPPTVLLVVGAGRKSLTTQHRLYNLYRPNTGIHHSLETMDSIKRRNLKKVSAEEAEEPWKAQYEAAANMCQHEFLFGSCRTATASHSCEVGKRYRTYYILSGSVLSVWDIVEKSLDKVPGKRLSRMQVIRVKTTEGQKIVGVWVPNEAKSMLITALEEVAGRSFLEKPAARL